MIDSQRLDSFVYFKRKIRREGKKERKRRFVTALSNYSCRITTSFYNALAEGPAVIINRRLLGVLSFTTYRSTRVINRTKGRSGKPIIQLTRKSD